MDSSKKESSTFPRSPETLPEALAFAARVHGEKGIAVFDRRGKTFERHTYREVLERAQASAARLARLGVQPGDRMPLCLPTSWAWLDAWSGALLCGAWPVALAPAGGLGAAEAHARRLDGVVEHLGARHLLCDEALKKELAQFGRQRSSVQTITPARLAQTPPVSTLNAAVPDPEATAFLQLTSGSTGRPRAVMISHRAALHNARAMDEAVGAPRGKPARAWIESVVCWLPLHHDMGLIGCLVFSILNGYDLWLMRPDTFLARPHVWLEHLGRHGAALAPAPNFAYQLCVERVAPEQLDGVDLSPWFAAMTGAEMIRPETVAAFNRMFSKRGFAPKSFRPCYGLAEGTLAVTFDRQGQGVRTRPAPQDAGAGFGLSEVVCTGPAVMDTEVRIRAPDGTPRPEGRIGEVQAQGPGIFSGYYRDPEATAEHLRDGWLVTGDLGFLHEGELYLTGRRKDILIVHGHNIMPHEIEWVAASVRGAGGTERSGAFSVAKGAAGEQVVLVMEVSERDSEALQALDREVRTRIGRRLTLPLADLIFVRRGRLPKTTSGKVQRLELRQRYLDGKLERLPWNE